MVSATYHPILGTVNALGRARGAPEALPAVQVASLSRGHPAPGPATRVAGLLGSRPMVSAPDYLLLLIGVLLLFGILATRLSPLLGVPALALFALAGMLAGVEGPGHISFHDATLARIVGTVALVGTLFSSGVNARWDTVSRVLRPAGLMAILGPIMATVLTALVARSVAGVPVAVGALLGAVVAATDPVALASVFRGRHGAIDARPMELLRFESAAGAAMSAFLVEVLLRWAASGESAWWRIVLAFLTSGVVGGLAGLLLGLATVWMLRHLQPEAEILYTLMTVAAGFLLYGVAAALHGSGFLAVFVGALVIGNSDLPDRGSMRRFHEGLPWMSQITLFVLLGLLVPLSALQAALRPGLLVTGVLLLAARPLAALFALPGNRLRPGTRLFVAWTGLKGSAPVALATLPFYARVPEAEWLLGVTAVVVLLSALVHGLTVPWLAGVLKVPAGRGMARPEPLDLVDLGPGTVACYHLDEQAPAAGRMIGDLNLPENCLLIMVLRDGEKIRPRGATRLSAGDEVYVYSPRELFPVLEIRLMGERGEFGEG